MNLTNIQNIDFEQVRNFYLQDHGSKNDPWELKQLEKANEKFGNWVYAEIPPKEIVKIVAPHYKVGGEIINPNTGAFLESTYENFIARLNHFKKYNPQFYQRFSIQKAIAPLKNLTLFLSQEPLFVGASYEGLTRFKGHITHLDGFHRLMGLIALIDDGNIIKFPIKTCIAKYPRQARPTLS